MTGTVLLDTGPLGVIANPYQPPHAVACRAWIARLQGAGRRVIIPEIADYELRRELILRSADKAVERLDWYGGQLDYLPLTTSVMRQAAHYWAMLRLAGLATAGPNELDGDCILAAQAISLGDPHVVVATTNVLHLSRFVAADRWENIAP